MIAVMIRVWFVVNLLESDRRESLVYCISVVLEFKNYE